MLQSYYVHLMFANLRAWVYTPEAIDFPKQQIRHECILTFFFLKGFSMDVY